MFDQIEFGEKLKEQRKFRSLTQEEVAEKIGVSGQAVSKWEKGECMPDVYNLKMLGKLFQISVDSLLATKDDREEKVIETYKIENAVFELIERPAAVYAGEMTDETTGFKRKLENFDKVSGRVLPECEICISVNFWSNGKTKKIFFGREVTTENQPDGIKVYKIPAGLFLRIYSNKENAGILGKDMCEPWEFFAYMWNYFMPENHLKESRNKDGEDNQIEIYDFSDTNPENRENQRSGWGYAAVERKGVEIL